MTPALTFWSLAALVLLLASCGAKTEQRQSVLIPPGTRAVSIIVGSDISVEAGDEVDVLVLSKELGSQTVLQQVKVLATDHKRVVTFLTSPQDAEKVMKAGELGKFSVRVTKSN